MTTVSRLGFRASRAVDRVRAASLRVPQPQSGPDILSLAWRARLRHAARYQLGAHAAIEAGYTHTPSQATRNCGTAADSCPNAARSPSRRDVLITHGGTGGLAAAILAIIDRRRRRHPGPTTRSTPTDPSRGRPLHTVPLQADLHWTSTRRRCAERRAGCSSSATHPTDGIVHTAPNWKRSPASSIPATHSSSPTRPTATRLHRQAVRISPRRAVLAARTLYCQTFSKAHAMTGWRIGYLADRATSSAPPRGYTRPSPSVERRHQRPRSQPRTAPARGAAHAQVPHVATSWSADCSPSTAAARRARRRVLCFPVRARTAAAEMVAHLRLNGVPYARQ